MDSIRDEQIKKWKKRPFSWSQYSSWLWNKEEWFDKYILNKPYKGTKETEFGSYVDLKIQNDPTFLPSLKRYEHMQYKLNIKLDGIHLVGIPDGLELTKSKELADYKTGKNKWDKKRADETGQLTFYLLLIYVTYKIKPEEFKCKIHWLPTQETGNFSISFVDNIENNIKTLETKRTMLDILKFAKSIKSVRKEMENYALAYKFI